MPIHDLFGITLFIQDTTPDGDNVRVGVLWSDTNSLDLLRCTQVSPSIIFASTEGGSAAHTLDSATHSDVAAITEAKGMILAYDSVAGIWDALSVGADGQVLTATSANDNGLSWSSAGAGDVTAALSMTDNAIVRGDGGAKGVQDSGILIDDSDNITGLATITIPNTGLHLLDTDASHDLIIAPGSNLTLDRTLTITTGDANRGLTLSGDLTVESASLVNQDLTSDASPTFAGATISGLTNSRLVQTNGSAALASVADLTSWVAGTANQISVADDGDGTLTLSTPQDIASTSNVSFGSSTLSRTGVGLDVQNSTDSASVQVAIFRSGNKTTPTNNDEGYISFYNENDSPAFVEFSRLTWVATDVANLSKDAQLELAVMSNDSLTTILTVDGTGISVVGDVSGTTIGGITEANLVDKTATEVISGSWDFGGAGSLEIPNSATPTVNANGEIALDTTVADWSHGIIRYFGGEELFLVAMPVAQLTTPGDGNVVAYNATNDEFELVAQAGGGTPGGSDTQVQYNNGGSFGGATGILWNDTGLITTLQNSTDAASNQVLILRGGDRTTPTDNDESYISFSLEDDSPGFAEFARLTWVATDVTNTSKDAQLELAVMSNNSLTDILLINNTGISVTGDVSGTTIGGITEANLVDKSASETISGSWDFGGASTFEIPNGAAPTVSVAGQIAIDTTITDHTGLPLYHDGTESLYVIAIPVGNLTTTDGHVIKYNATNNEFEMAADAGGGGGNTLDQAYDQGGAGAGRSITADNGAVLLQATSLGGDDLLDVDHTASGTLTANTTNMITFDSSRTHTGATTLTDNFDVLSISRTSISNNASADLTANGSILRLENVATQTLGTLSDNVILIELVQDSDSSGVAIDIRQTGNSNPQFSIDDDGTLLWGTGSATPDVQLSRTGVNTLSLAAGDTFSAPTINVSGLTANRLVQSNGSSTLASVSDLTSWIAGTTNQISVADDLDGTVTLSTPQDIATTSNVSFGSATLTRAGIGLDVQNSTDNASVQVAIFRSGDKTTPTANDEGYLSFYNEDSGSSFVEFSRLTFKATDVTAASKDAQFEFAVMSVNSLTDILLINGTGISVTGDISGTTIGGITEANLVDKSAAEAITGAWDFGGATSLEVPNGAGGTVVNAAGEVTVDTTPTYGHFNFHDGTAERVVPTLYSKSITIETPTASDDITMFHTEEAITVQILRTVVRGTTPSATVDIHHSTDRSAAGNALITTPAATTSESTGSDVTTFDDATIPADSWVWVEFDAVSGTVDECSITLHYTVDA